MRKPFFWIVLILLPAAAGVFIAGWVQFAVPPGAYGVLRSKISGIDPGVLRNGEFRWSWERLLPTNVVIAVFKLDPVDRTLEAAGELPSAHIYADLIGTEGIFSYRLSGLVSYIVKGSALPLLVAEKGIVDQAGLDHWEARVGDELAAYALQRLRVYAEEPAELERIAELGSTPQLRADLEGAFPDLEILNYSLSVAAFPDMALYRSAKGLYDEYLARQKELLAPGVSDEAQRAVALRRRLDELAQYGDLLTKYPILLDYLALESKAQR